MVGVVVVVLLPVPLVEPEVLPVVPVVPPLPTEPLVLPPMPVLPPVVVLVLLPAEERWSRMHWSRSAPARWSQFATLGPVVVVVVALGAVVVVLVLGVVVVVVLVLVSLLELAPVLGELLEELLGELIEPLELVLVSVLELLGEVELPELALPDAASFMHFSFSAPLMCSQAPFVTALVSLVLEVLGLLLGRVAPELLVALGVVALGLLAELLPELCAIDAPAMPSSAAATAAVKVFIFIRLSSRG